MFLIKMATKEDLNCIHEDVVKIDEEATALAAKKVN